MARFWNTPIFILATVYFVVDGVFGCRRCFCLRHAAHKRVDCKKEAVRARANLGDFVAALPFAGPFCRPCHYFGAGQALRGYLIGTGHFFAGAVTFITAEVLKLTFVERLFHLNRTKLLSIPAFACGYRYWRYMMDVVESLEVWKASRRLAHKTGQIFRSRWLQLKNSRRAPCTNGGHAVRHHS
jgi:hypothetical protein